MRISVALLWDAGAGAFQGTWNGQKLDLPAADVARLGGSAFDAEARYDAGGLKILKLERAIPHPSFVTARALLGRGKASDALAELSQVGEEVLGIDPSVRSLRAMARASTGDVAGAAADVELVLGAATLGSEPLHYVGDTLRVLPAEAGRALLPRFCARLGALDTPLGLARNIPDALWTRETLLEVIRTCATATIGHPWIVEEFREQARRVGVSEAAIEQALGANAANLVSAGAREDQRTILARQHAKECERAADEPDGVGRMLTLLRQLNDGNAPGLVAAIELTHPDDTPEELDDLRSSLRVELGAPARANDIQPVRSFVREVVGEALPPDYEAFLAAANGLRLGWSEVEIFDAAKVVKSAGRIENPKGVVHAVLPFGNDGFGFMQVLIVSRGTVQVTELERGVISPHPQARSFSEWFCRFIGEGMQLPLTS